MSELKRFFRMMSGSSVFVCAVFLCFVGICEGRFLEPKDADHWPHVWRSATVATNTMGTGFLSADNLGNHTYTPNGTEKTGIAYACRGGHIDIAHLRKAADWTAYLASKTLKSINENRTVLSYKLYEPSIYRVTLSYPDDWLTLPADRRERISREVSIGLAQHFAFTALTWHEVLTWFGYKTLGILSEFESSFSWEDMFSNVLGTHLSVQALRDPFHSYNDAMTILLDREMKRLGGQSSKTARKASNAVRGLWWSYNLIFLSMKKRNFDIGLDDGYITPWLVPSVSQCKGVEPISYPIPSLEVLDKYGFIMKLEIELHAFEGPKILNVVYPEGRRGRNRIEPAVHMPVIMEYLRKRAIRRWGPYFDNPRVKNSKSESDASSEVTEPDEFDDTYLFDVEDAYVFNLGDVAVLTEWWLDDDSYGSGVIE